MRYKIYKSEAEFTYKDRFEIKGSCTLDKNAEVEEVAEFGSPEAAQEALSKYKSNVEEVKGWTEFVYEVKEYYLLDEELFQILDFSEMSIPVKDEDGVIINYFDNFYEAEKFVNHDDRELKIMV